MERTEQLCDIHLRDEEKVPALGTDGQQNLCIFCFKVIGGKQFLPILSQRARDWLIAYGSDPGPDPDGIQRKSATFVSSLTWSEAASFQFYPMLPAWLKDEIALQPAYWGPREIARAYRPLRYLTVYAVHRYHKPANSQELPQSPEPTEDETVKNEHPNMALPGISQIDNSVQIDNRMGICQDGELRPISEVYGATPQANRRDTEQARIETVAQYPAEANPSAIDGDGEAVAEETMVLEVKIHLTHRKANRMFERLPLDTKAALLSDMIEAAVS